MVEFERQEMQLQFDAKIVALYKDILKIRAVLTTHGIKVVHLRIIIEHSARKRSHAPKADI